MLLTWIKQEAGYDLMIDYDVINVDNDDVQR